MDEAPHPIVILYEHPLLGEGIATYLRVHAGVEAVIVRADDPDAVRAALAVDPGVVIFERSGPEEQLDVAALSPNAVLIDVSTVFRRGVDAVHAATGFEQIVTAVTGVVASRQRHASGVKSRPRPR